MRAAAAGRRGRGGHRAAGAWAILFVLVAPAAAAVPVPARASLDRLHDPRPLLDAPRAGAARRRRSAAPTFSPARRRTWPLLDRAHDQPADPRRGGRAVAGRTGAGALPAHSARARRRSTTCRASSRAIASCSGATCTSVRPSAAASCSRSSSGPTRSSADAIAITGDFVDGPLDELRERGRAAARSARARRRVLRHRQPRVLLARRASGSARSQTLRPRRSSRTSIA